MIEKHIALFYEEESNEITEKEVAYKIAYLFQLGSLIRIWTDEPKRIAVMVGLL